MANLATNKLPIEKSDWKTPEVATNGDVTNYDGSNGYAEAPWPCLYTIDLNTVTQITAVRFLLWDNLGRGKFKVDSRKYKFTLSISADGGHYQQLYTNKNEDGGNGWYEFNFLNETFTKFVRLEGHYNSANEMFHLVEFEIHDQNPEPLNSNNIHLFNIVTGIPGEDRINEMLDIAIAKKSEVFKGLDEKLKQIDNTLNQSTTLIEQIELIKQSIDFQRESVNNIRRSNWWLGASIIAATVFITILLWFIFCDTHATGIIKEASKDLAIAEYTTFLLASYYVSKALLLSVLVFVITWCLKNYRSERHNYVINKHKAMSLTVAISILTGEQYGNTSRGHVFIDAMKIVFAHQSSGFSTDDTATPSIVNTLLAKES